MESTTTSEVEERLEEEVEVSVTTTRAGLLVLARGLELMQGDTPEWYDQIQDLRDRLHDDNEDAMNEARDFWLDFLAQNGGTSKDTRPQMAPEEEEEDVRLP